MIKFSIYRAGEMWHWRKQMPNGVGTSSQTPYESPIAAFKSATRLATVYGGTVEIPTGTDLNALMNAENAEVIG